MSRTVHMMLALLDRWKLLTFSLQSDNSLLCLIPTILDVYGTWGTQFTRHSS